jgi:ketol-acid reductoisomerase
MGRSEHRLFAGKAVAILGYGLDAREQALRLRASDVRVVIGLRENDLLCDVARQDGFTVLSLWGAVETADIIQVWW